MSKRARVSFKFVVQGNGRDTVVFKQPLTPNSDFSQSTDGNVSLNSPALVGQVVAQPGWNQLIDPAAYLTSPMARNYYALIVPYGGSGQTLPPSLTLAGATTDMGVGLVVGAPIILALPAGPASLYLYNWGSYPLVFDNWCF